MEKLTDILIHIANNSIPKSKPTIKKHKPSGAIKTAKQPLKLETKLLNGCKNTVLEEIRHSRILTNTESSGPKPGV